MPFQGWARGSGISVGMSLLRLFVKLTSFPQSPISSCISQDGAGTRSVFPLLLKLEVHSRSSKNTSDRRAKRSFRPCNDLGQLQSTFLKGGCPSKYKAGPLMFMVVFISMSDRWSRALLWPVSTGVHRSWVTCPRSLPRGWSRTGT